MDGWLKKTLGLGLSSLFVLIAVNGEKFAASLSAALAFLVELTAKAPLGVWSFLLALSIATVAQAFLALFLDIPCAKRRDAVLAACGFALGAGLMYLQLPTRNGVLLALLVGFVSPFTHQCIAGLWSLAKRDKATP